MSMDSYETHDWWEGLVEAELARLRAEVERLHKSCASFDKHIETMERERDEALAQVAVLLDALDKERQCRHAPELGHIVEFPPRYAPKARALLDRLRLAEAVVEAARLHPNLCWPELQTALAAWEEHK